MLPAHLPRGTVLPMRRCDATRFRMAPHLVQQVYERLGVQPPQTLDEMSTLLQAVNRRIPSGNSTKLEALQEGKRPPGEDPAMVARRWLDDPGASWTCWARATLVCALLADGGWPAHVRMARRWGPRRTDVDAHAVVRLDGGGQQAILDPHFNLGPLQPDAGGQSRAGMWGEAVSVGGRVQLLYWSTLWASSLLYNLWSVDMTPADVAMWLRISRVFTGVDDTPMWRAGIDQGEVLLRLVRPGWLVMRQTYDEDPFKAACTESRVFEQLDDARRLFERWWA